MNFTNHIQQVETSGFTLIPSALTPEECQTYVKELEKTYDKYSAGYADKAQNEMGLHNKELEKTVYNLHNKSNIWMQLFDHEVVHQIIGPLLQEGSIKF